MEKLLLVDDVTLFLELERAFLDGLGYEIVTASTGEEALVCMDEMTPALVLLDLYLPGIDGDEVCRRLRADARWPDLPIIMVTAAGKEEDVKKCLAAGCDDYVTKPVGKADLLEKVQRLLGRVKGRQAPRTPVSLRVQVRGGGKSLSARALDLSCNGVYVRSRSRLTPGTAVELKLELPDKRVLPVLGKVKRVREGAEGGMGIYFIHPEAEGVAVLERLVEEGRKDQPQQAAQPKGGDDGRQARIEKENAALSRENQRLHQRILELEEENREFAESLVQTEEINSNLSNLYIASSRLHSVLDRDEVMRIICEVVINFVGAEAFALLLLDKEGRELVYETGEGFAPEVFPVIPLGEGVIGSAVSEDRNYFQQKEVSTGSDDPLAPLAAIPLRIHGRPMGALAVYRLFVQKEEFVSVDYQLFSLLAENAATALFSSTLYADSERKRETYRGFMELLLK
ncbi:MAG TPA: response regulator [Desulfuromonadales bacterium]|nr:response regulator [Desulfuromonadales bacterium]